jgi:predicted  nucleic acid-binding Zn-ribbon protein
MLPEIENLLKLQDVDKEIRRLQDEVAELPRRVSAIEARLAGTKAQLDKAQAALKTDEAARRKYEASITELRTKISKYRDQSLDVKTNEQYRALLHEIQFAEKEIAANEDKILDFRKHCWRSCINFSTRRELKSPALRAYGWGG